MIDPEAFKKMSYGLYVVCSGNQNKGNGYISNSVFQVTAKPARIAASCHKNNFSAQIIKETGSFAVSILQSEAETSVIDRFGYRSGSDINKLNGMNVEYGATGVPILLNSCIAWIECKVINSLDVGTHIIFIGEVLQTEVTDANKSPLTYNEFKKKKKRVAPSNAPTYIEEKSPDASTDNGKKFRCKQCGYVYDDTKEGIPFDSLPDNWKCPVCGAPKSDFEAI
ncbi:MAG: hypothetical protein PWQ17_1920 [Anaerophaga sp.]|nr:hypothetical protein [Anaerophaga sp.]MDN5291736.1 hypothetical protein [Anaerophaga sp.]